MTSSRRRALMLAGTAATSAMTVWDNISSGEYVSDTYVKTGSDGYIASRCS